MIVLRETLLDAGFAMILNLPVQIVLVVVVSIVAGVLWRKPEF
jgi:membrane protein implicated in regulation of membrane protease activity